MSERVDHGEYILLGECIRRQPLERDKYCGPKARELGFNEQRGSSELKLSFLGFSLFTFLSTSSLQVLVSYRHTFILLSAALRV
jgi:hypothetical protein